MKKISLILLILIQSISFPQARAVVNEHYFETLKMNKKYSVVLPSNYTNNRIYPIIYLLHGYGGSYKVWLDDTELINYAEHYDYIFVMADADNSWYVNSKITDSRYEDYIVNELPKIIKADFSIDTSKQFIVGLSMGGYGSIILGLRNPNKYKFIGAMSSSMDVPGQKNDLIKFKREWLRPSLNDAFGNDQSYIDEHDHFKIISNSQSKNFPYIYLVTGIHENYRERLTQHRNFADLLREKNLNYEYHETPGGHDYIFWDREIKLIIQRIEELFGKKSLK